MWTAVNEQLDVPVAIKFMAPETVGSSELVTRFEREAKLAAQMRIPQVVQIFEHGVYDRVPFMVMELLDGEDLSARLRQKTRLSMEETAPIVTEVCKALRRAKELEVVHRDLKPANIFLAKSGDEEVIKVLDFGIAKMLGTGSAIEATKTGSLIGTPSYMSPEQAHRKHGQVDQRSDLWSLAVIAFRCVTGKLPFGTGEPVEILMRIITQNAPPPSEMAADLDPEIDRFFARALARAPADRFQNARDLAEAFAALAAPHKEHPLAQSWATQGPPRTASYVGPLRLEIPAPRASSPGAPPQAQNVRSTVPMNAASTPTIVRDRGHSEPDLDEVATVPIQRSTAAQAYLAAPAPPQGGLSRQPSSPRGFPPPAPSRPSAAPPAPAHPQAPAYPPAPAQASAPSKAPEPWKGSSTDRARPFLATLPLGTPAADHPPPPRPAQSSVPDGSAALTSASDAGTITSATGELPLRSQRRTSMVIWAALSAVVLVIVVVGSAIYTTLNAAPEPEPFPVPTVAPTAGNDVPHVAPAPVPTAAPAPAPSATVSAKPTASATATAKPPASIMPSAPPAKSPAQGANVPWKSADF